jgi:hypothetical protein
VALSANRGEIVASSHQLGKLVQSLRGQLIRVICGFMRDFEEHEIVYELLRSGHDTHSVILIQTHSTHLDFGLRRLDHPGINDDDVFGD